MLKQGAWLIWRHPFQDVLVAYNQNTGDVLTRTEYQTEVDGPTIVGPCMHTKAGMIPIGGDEMSMEDALTMITKEKV